MSINLSKKLMSVSIIALVSATFLGGCGGSSSSSGGATTQTPTPTPTPTPTGATFSLNGATTKGLILNGNVDVIDAADSSTILVSGTTSATDGTYALTIPDTANFDGPFVMVTVSGGAGAMMICDAASGCEDSAGTVVSFGESFAIDSNVSLSAVVPTPSDGQSDTVNLNIFTDLAASLAQSGTLSETTLNDANAQVGNLFGLGATNPADLASINIADAGTSVIDSADLRAGIISGGVLGAVFENGTDIGATLDAFRTSFAANDGQIVVNEAVDDTAVISLEEIFGDANEAADASAVTGSDVASVSAQIFGDANEARGAEADELSSAGVAPSNNAPALDQAKAFVDDLQLIIAAVDQQPNGDNIVDFAERVEEAGNLVLVDAESALEAALEGGIAIALAYEAFQDDDTITSFSNNGILVDISSQDGELMLNIASQAFRDETIQMTVMGDLDVAFTESETEERDPETGNTLGESEGVNITIDGDAEFTGLVENSAIRLEVLSGEMSVAGGFFDTESNFEQSGDGGSSSQSAIILAERASAALEIKVSEKREQGLAFEGLATGSLVGPRFENSEASIFEQEEFFRNDGSNDFLFTRAETGTVNGRLDAANAAFSGQFSHDGQFVDLSFGLQQEANELRVGFESEATEVLETYTVEDNVFTRFSANGDIRTYELITQAEAQAEIDAIISSEATAEVSDFRETGLRVRVDGRTVLTADIPDPDALVYRNVIVRANEPDFRLYRQAETLVISIPASPEFLASPPTNIVDYFNQGVIIQDGIFSISCTGEDELTPILTERQFYNPEGGVIGATPLVGQNASLYCNREDIGFDTFILLETERELAASFGATSSALVAASISQNIAGIDPDDTEVTASFFGPVNFANDEVSGNITFRLDFAGRSFETDARNIDIFDDLTVPVTVTNQDGVMMVIFEDQNGEATGSITLDGVEQGVITEGNGVPIVTFTDNTFVSLQ